MSTPMRIESADDVALSTMRDHHTQLRADLESRLAALRDAVAAGAPHESAQAALTEFVDRAVLPHAAAEEESLYPAAADHGVGVFIASMVLEHRELEHHAQALRSAATAVRALSIGEAIAAVFAVHVRKENDLLLPALMKHPDVHLWTLLVDMRERLTQPPDQHARATGVTENLDIRALAHGVRHEIVFDRLDALAPGEKLSIVNDHDPKPLRYQLDAAWPGTFGWAYLLAGPDVWRIEITRLG